MRISYLVALGRVPSWGSTDGFNAAEHMWQLRHANVVAAVVTQYFLSLNYHPYASARWSGSWLNRLPLLNQDPNHLAVVFCASQSQYCTSLSQDKPARLIIRFLIGSDSLFVMSDVKNELREGDTSLCSREVVRILAEQAPFAQSGS